MSSSFEVKEYMQFPRRRIWQKRIGNCEGFIYKNSGDPVMVLGPQPWHFLSSFFLIFGPLTLFFISSYHLMTHSLKLLTWSSYIISILAFLIAGLKNPGIDIQIGLKSEEILKYFNDRKFCRVCEVIRNEGCLHCIECDVCIKQRAFHSMLIGKCVGKENYYYYYLGIVLVFVGFGMIFISIFKYLI